MASLIPILQDIIPMLRPGKVQVVRSSELRDDTGQTEGMIRKGAIVGMADHLCASVMIAKPHTSSAVHHHAEQETIIYAASGHGAILTNPSMAPPPAPKTHTTDPTLSTNTSDNASRTTPPMPFSDQAPRNSVNNNTSHLKKLTLSPGDFALIPAWTEHQEVNESDEDVVWIITRSGSTPVVVNLKGWGGGRE